MPTFSSSPNFTSGDTQASGTVHQFTGSITVSASTCPLIIQGAATLTGAGNAQSYLALDSNSCVVLTSSFYVPGSGGGGGGLVTTYSNAGNNRILTSVNGSTINGESNLSFDGSTLTVTGDVTSTGNTTLGNALADYHQVTGTLSMSGSALEVFNGDIKVSSSAQYTVEGGSDTFYGLMKFYDTAEGQEKFVSGAVWNITQERVELRNFGQDTGYYSFAADTFYADGGLQFIGGNMTISDGDILGNGSLSITGQPLTLNADENTTLKLVTGYKAGEATGIMQIMDADDAVWSAHSISGTLINGALTATGSAILGNASTDYHQVSGTLDVSGSTILGRNKYGDIHQVTGALDIRIDGSSYLTTPGAGMRLISDDQYSFFRILNSTDQTANGGLTIGLNGANAFIQTESGQNGTLQIGTNNGTQLTMTDAGIATYSDNFTIQGNTTLGDASTDYHQVSGTFAVSGSLTANHTSNYYFSASISDNVDAACNEFNVFNYSLAGNIALTASSPVAGASYLFFLRQDGAGSRTATFQNFMFPAGTAPTLSTDASAVDIISGVSDGVNIYADTTKDFS